MQEDTFARALMYQVLQLYQKQRPTNDIISELEEHIRNLEDGDDHVITRGC